MSAEREGNDVAGTSVEDVAGTDVELRTEGLPDAKVRGLDDAQRRVQGAAAGHRIAVLLLLGAQTLVSIALVIYYNHVYDVTDQAEFVAAVDALDYVEIARILSSTTENYPTQHIKNTYTAFLSVSLVLNFVAGLVSIGKLNRPGIRVAILCLVTVWSTMHLQMSLDKGLTVLAGVVNLACVVTAAGLLRLSDAIQEYRIGSDYTPPTDGTIRMWRVVAALSDVCLCVMGVIVIVLPNTLDLAAAVRAVFIHVVQWTAAILGGVGIFAGTVGLVGNLGLRVFHSRFMLISCVALSMAVLSSACVELYAYSLLEGALELSCSLADHEGLFGWDDEKCDAQQSTLTASVAVLFLYIVTSGFSAWANLCLSEAVQSHGIAKGGEASFLWTVGHPLKVAGRTVSRVAVTRFLATSDVFLQWTLGVFLCAFTIGITPERKSIGSYLDWWLKDMWLCVGGVLCVAFCRWTGHHTSVIEPRYMSFLVLVWQLWLVGNALNTFLYALSVYEYGFTYEPWFETILGFGASQYLGDRRDLFGGAAVISGLLFASQLPAVCLNFMEIESDYSSNDVYIWQVTSAASTEEDLGEA